MFSIDRQLHRVAAMPPNFYALKRAERKELCRM
nr:MAG TPA: hypothetical protein [Caudoviricetes sp.]